MRHHTIMGRPLALGLVSLALVACENSADDLEPFPPFPDPPPAAVFEVTVTNLTNAQPLSPVAVIAHTDGYQVFAVGQAASPGLEELAEGGSPASLIAEADASAAVIETTAGTGPIGPGASETIRLVVLESELNGLRLSTSTMLVNTNDAITGTNAIGVGDFISGDRASYLTIAYDAGTEANDELAIHIPGPAAGGEGFNAARDDIADRVAMHTGVVGAEDGFPGSDLDGQHRFDNPVARVTIERVE